MKVSKMPMQHSIKRHLKTATIAYIFGGAAMGAISDRSCDFAFNTIRSNSNNLDPATSAGATNLAQNASVVSITGGCLVMGQLELAR